MKKTLTAILTFALIFSFTACSSSKLADVFKEDEVVTRAKNTVETINTPDYDAVVSELREDLKSQLSADDLESAWGPQLNEAGTFKDYTTVVTYGQKDETTDEDYAVCVLVCKYENASLTFTISMDPDLEIVGLYMK